MKPERNGATHWKALVGIGQHSNQVIDLKGLLFGDSSTVEQRTLTPLILVRIQVPEPSNFTRIPALKSSDVV